MTACGEGTMRWRSWGEGRPLVLLHGGNGSWCHWIRNIDFFSERGRVIVPDLPGFGDSAEPPGPPDSLTHAMLAEILVAGLRSFLEMKEPIDLVGFSFSGTLSGEMARSLGRGVRNLVLTSPGGYHPLPTPAVAFRKWRSAPPADQAAVHRHNLAQLMFGKADSIDALAVQVQALSAAKSRLRSRNMDHPGVLRPMLARLPARIHGIWGGLDATTLGRLEANCEFMRSCSNSGTVEVVEDAGHWVQYESADRFNTILGGILSTPPAGAMNGR